jgi:hypothetical protein
MTIKIYNFRYIIKYEDVPRRKGTYEINAHKIGYDGSGIYLAWTEVEDVN